MRNIDSNGLLLCELVAKVFEESYDKYNCSSEIFIRRFMFSDVSRNFDNLVYLAEPTTTDDIFNEIDKEYEETGYGKNKYSKNILYWIGYMYMYGAYVYTYYLRSLYRFIKPKELYDLYFGYHSFDCDYAWQRIFEFKQKSLTPEGLLKEGIKICRSIKKLDRVHYMNLVSEAFELIQKGEKTVEIGLNDEKRSQIKIGDQIVFTNLKTKEMIETYVRDLKVYNDFYELYESYDKKSLGYKKNEKADPEDMFKYYTKEKIAKYGALAISLERVQNKKLNLTN